MADFRLVRVQCFYIDDPAFDRDVTEQLLFDLKINALTADVTGAQPYFGAYGSLGDQGRCPFILLSDGRMDFGDQTEAKHDRYWTTNIRTRAIREGEKITVEGDEPWTYRIANISDL